MEGSFVGPKRHSSRPSTESCRQLGTWTSDELGPSLAFRNSLNPPACQVESARIAYAAQKCGHHRGRYGPASALFDSGFTGSLPNPQIEIASAYRGIESSGGAEGYSVVSGMVTLTLVPEEPESIWNVPPN